MDSKIIYNGTSKGSIATSYWFLYVMCAKKDREVRLMAMYDWNGNGDKNDMTDNFIDYHIINNGTSGNGTGNLSGTLSVVIWIVIIVVAILSGLS